MKTTAKAKGDKELAMPQAPFKPEMPPSAFFYFMVKFRKNNPGRLKMARDGAAEWKKLKRKSKAMARYEDEAQKKMALYEERLQDYQKEMEAYKKDVRLEGLVDTEKQNLKKVYRPEVKMLAAGEVPRHESYTTIVSMVFKDCAFVGADSRISVAPFGHVIGNSYHKIIRVYKGFLLLCSGCSDVTDELRWALPLCFKTRKPKSFEDALDRVVGWVNFFSEYIRSDVKLILIGAVGNEDMQTGVVEKMQDITGYVHKRSLIKSKVQAMGSGRQIARQDIGTLRNKKILNNKSLGINIQEEESAMEKEGIKIIFDGLKKAGGTDWCTGGNLRAVCMTREGDAEYVRIPKNPGDCKSNYKEMPPVRNLYKRKIHDVDGQNLKRKKGGPEDSNEEKRKGKRKIEEVEEQDLMRKKRGAEGIVIRN